MFELNFKSVCHDFPLKNLSKLLNEQCQSICFQYFHMEAYLKKSFFNFIFPYILIFPFNFPNKEKEINV